MIETWLQIYFLYFLGQGSHLDYNQPRWSNAWPSTSRSRPSKAWPFITLKLPVIQTWFQIYFLYFLGQGSHLDYNKPRWSNAWPSTSRSRPSKAWPFITLKLPVIQTWFQIYFLYFLGQGSHLDYNQPRLSNAWPSTPRSRPSKAWPFIILKLPVIQSELCELQYMIEVNNFPHFFHSHNFPFS